MGVQLSDNDFKRNSTAALVFRKHAVHEADKVAELAQKGRCEAFDLELQDAFSSLARDLAASDVAKDSQVDETEFGACQGSKGWY